MRIGIDARMLYYRTGGISTYIRELTNQLVRLDQANDYTILLSRKMQTSVPANWHTGRLWTPSHHRLERLALGLELSPRHLDIFHATDFIAPWFGARRQVITVHDLTFLRFPETLTPEGRRYYNAQIHASVARAAHIVCVSQSTRHDLMTLLNVPAEKITVTPNGVSAAFTPLARQFVTERLAVLGLPPQYFLHVGTWEPRKNLLALATAWLDVTRNRTDAPPLILVGRVGWHYEQLRAAIDALEPGGRILWRDDISDADLPILYNGAIAVVVASLYEGFGLPALEAMACGVVPLVSNTSSLPEVVGDVGRMFDPHDTDDIASTLAYALHHPHWREAQYAPALAQAQHFTWQRCAQATLAVYQSLA